MNPNDLSDLRAEFDKFVSNKCSIDQDSAAAQNPDAGDKVDDYHQLKVVCIYLV